MVYPLTLDSFHNMPKWRITHISHITTNFIEEISQNRQGQSNPDEHKVKDPHEHSLIHLQLPPKYQETYFFFTITNAMTII